MKAAGASGMRIFVPVFAAILAAAVVILLFLGAKSRFDNWVKAKNACLATINSLERYHQETYENSQGGSIDELAAAIKAMRETRTEIDEMEKQLAIVLEHKPFFLPLTRDEQKLLDNLKSDLGTATAEATPTPTAPDTIKHDTQIHPENIIQDAPASSLSNKTTAEATSTPTTEMITLTKPVSMQVKYGTVTLPVGTKVEFVSKVGTEVHVRYLGSDQMIPISATDLK